MPSSQTAPRRMHVMCLPVTVLAVAAIVTAVCGAEDPKVEGIDRKPSTYAPARDLEAQVAEFMDRIEKSLAAEGEYGEDQQDHVVKDANTLAVIALVLSNHDGQVNLQAPGAKVIQASLNLAEAAKEYAAAKAAFAELQNALKSVAGREPLKWESVGDIAELMLQVPNLNSTLRRGVIGRRFESSRDKTAGLTATLAAIAQVSIYDDTYCSDEEEQTQWAQLFVRMRDAAANCNGAIRAGDQEKARHWLTEMTRACDDCHEKFNQ